MIKILLKTITTVCLAIILVLGCYNFSYADVVDMNLGEISLISAMVHLPIIVLVVLCFCFASYLNLKDTIKRQEKLENEGKGRTISIEKINEKRKLINGGFKFCFFCGLAFGLAMFRYGNEIFISISIYALIAIFLFLYLASILFNNKKQIKLEKEGRVRTVSNEKIEKNIIQGRNMLYTYFTIVTIIELLMSDKYKEFTMFIFIPVITLVVSIIIKLLKNRRLANIFCFIAMIAIISINLCNYITDKIKEDFNTKFTQHIRMGYWAESNDFVFNIKELIETTIENNEKNDKKVVLIYKNKNYIESNELKNLEKVLKNYKEIHAEVEYGTDSYLKEIRLGGMSSRIRMKIEQYEGNKISGNIVRQLIRVINTEEISVEIELIDENGNEEDYYVNDKNYKEIISKIQTSNTYKVEIIDDCLRITCNQ